jgi:hypothetical protein
VKKSWKVAATVAAMSVLLRAGIAEAMDVGALEDVRQNVYGVAPQGGEAVKRKGDPVLFQETLETLDESSALVRFIDDSKLSIGAKSKVLIDEFVFDPENAKGNALIDISVGTLRFVTGEMPKGGVVIKTPTATLTLRGTDVVVHVHPDGTTDTTVYDGKVEAQNNITNEVTHLLPGDGATLGHGGTTDYSDDDRETSFATNNVNSQSNAPEHRRGDSPVAEHPTRSAPATGGDAGGGDDGGDGCGCI